MLSTFQIVDCSKIRLEGGRKKQLRNEMDHISGYGDDIYGYGDFNQESSKVQCSICHKEGHQMEKHKEGPKNLPKKQRNRVSRNSSVVVRKSLYIIMCFEFFETFISAHTVDHSNFILFIFK